MHERFRNVIAPATPATPRDAATFADFKSFLRLRRRAILIPLVVALAAAFAYIDMTVPTFTARTQVIIDPRMPQFIPGRANDSVMAWDTAQVESEIAVLQSERIAGLVVKKLGLDADPNFRTPPSLWSRLVGWMMSQVQKPGPPVDGFREAIGTVGEGLNVRRTGLSYAIDITFTSPDPALAQQIANATADAYIADQLQNRADAARVGGEWLQDRMTQLRSQMNAASRAVQAFRANHDYSVPVVPGGSQGAKTLDELDSDAATYRRIYESFLQSYTESVQRQSFPVSDAHVLTEASLPQFKSAPKGTLVFALAGLVGSLFGIGLAVLLHKVDRTVRSAAQVAGETGIDSLGTVSLPRRRGSALRRAAAWFGAGRFGMARGGLHGFKTKRDGTLHDIDVPCVTAATDGRHPAFCRDMTTVKTYLDLAQPGRRLGCIGVTAGQRGAGSSVLAGNLAMMYAEQGWKTLLIDGDLGRRTLSRALGSQGRPGLMQVLDAKTPLSDAVIPLGAEGPDFLPAFDLRTPPRGKRVLVAQTLGPVLRQATEAYDVVVFDLPPALPFGGVLALSPYLEGLILVVRSGSDTLDRVATVLDGMARAQARVLGFVLTRTPARAA